VWNHNSHYHNYLLHRIPARLDHTLDIGCGLGHFASKLAERSRFVHALDVDRATLEAASNLHPAPNISYIHADFLTADLPEATYDVIVAIASLHHIDLESALNKMKRLLRPSGKLLILGLYQEMTLIDYSYSLISIPLNWLFLRLHRATATKPKIIAPTRSANLPLSQIKAIANICIPNFILKRHLFWRYSLTWQKP